MPSLSIERERQARRELGVTGFSRGVKEFLCASFIAIVAGGTLWHLAADVTEVPGAWPHAFDPRRLLPAWEEVRAVRAESGWPAAARAANDRINVNIADYEADIEERSPVIGAFVPIVNRLVTGLLGGSTESVYRGRGPWWFYRPDIDYVTGPGFLDGRRRDDAGRQWHPMPAIAELHRALAGRGIVLVVAPVPLKPSIYPHRFSARYDDVRGPIQNPSWPRLLALMDAAGIAYVDLGQALGTPRRSEESLYLATDTHWSPAGLGVGAAAMAATVRRLDLSWLRPPVPHVRAPLEIAGIGDTLAMLDIADAPVETVAVQRVSGSDGSAWTPDSGAEILLLGDSFANIYSDPNMGWGSSAGLAAQLSAELARPVDALTVNDNGSYATRAALAAQIRRGRDRLAGKKVVIYEFASRELAFGDWRTGFAYGQGD